MAKKEKPGTGGSPGQPPPSTEGWPPPAPLKKPVKLVDKSKPVNEVNA